MRKSEAKEPPTVGKPVINDPPAESEADGQRAMVFVIAAMLAIGVATRYMVETPGVLSSVLASMFTF